MSDNLEKKEVAEKVYYDQSDMQGEMMRYRANSLSYKYGMLAIVFSILAAFISLNSVLWDVEVFLHHIGLKKLMWKKMARFNMQKYHQF